MKNKHLKHNSLLRVRADIIDPTRSGLGGATVQVIGQLSNIRNDSTFTRDQQSVELEHWKARNGHTGSTPKELLLGSIAGCLSVFHPDELEVP